MANVSSSGHRPRDANSSRMILGLAVLVLVVTIGWCLIQDHQSPQLKEVNHRDRVMKGENQVTSRVGTDRPHVAPEAPGLFRLTVAPLS